MADSPSTRPSLLVRLRDSQDHEAWTQFVNVYGPLIYGFARRQGVQDADAADLMQESLRVVARAIKQLDYDPERGSFRGWLFTVVRNQLLRFWSRQQRAGRGSGSTSAHERLQELPSPDSSPDALWDEEYDRCRFTWAAEQVRGKVQPATWEAFWKTAVEGRNGKEVAAALGMSVAAVYLAKSRVMARLKAQLRQVLGD
ncbi:MAG TPA: sigma-70 family RNA polymerase sigma factor [Gemmataceae bacterium]|jgi:RNA polymerase sigma-70 factor (ECF subfamily)